MPPLVTNKRHYLAYHNLYMNKSWKNTQTDSYFHGSTAIEYKLNMTPEQRKELGINKSTMVYPEEPAEGQEGKYYEVRSKIVKLFLFYECLHGPENINTK